MHTQFSEEELSIKLDSVYSFAKNSSPQHKNFSAKTSVSTAIFLLLALVSVKIVAQGLSPYSTHPHLCT